MILDEDIGVVFPGIDLIVGAPRIDLAQPTTPHPQWLSFLPNCMPSV